MNTPSPTPSLTAFDALGGDRQREFDRAAARAARHAAQSEMIRDVFRAVTVDNPAYQRSQKPTRHLSVVETEEEA